MIGSERIDLGRRGFIKAGLVAGAGLTLGVCLPGTMAAESGAEEAGVPFSPNAFVRIGEDDTVTVIIKHLEMGQGTYTGLATLVAEELDAAWTQVWPEGAPANDRLYNNLFWGRAQGTGGSSAIANSFLQMRKAGAAAREMLVAAAANRWEVSADTITVQEGVVRHDPSGRRAGFGELAREAAGQPVPTEVLLKDPAEFRLIGTRLPRKDSREKVNGNARYTQDVKLPGMLTAAVLHAPRFGAVPGAYDARAARLVPGVEDVVALPNGVAVLARDFWSATRGRDALKVDWDESRAFRLGSDAILAEYKRLARRPGRVARREGDADGALGRSTRTLEASYEFPYLAHAAMEPMNCVMRMDGDGVEIWNGEQFQTSDQQAVAKVLGIPPEKVRIHMLYAGGSFGRRANPQSDYVVETARILKATGGRYPVKLVWTREDDMRAGYYRPMYLHTLKAGLDEQGRISAWRHRIVGQSILAGTAFEKALVKAGVDQTSVEGAANLPYAIPNLTVDLHSPDVGVPVQWWRSVGSTHTAFVTETFLDELAAALGRDPLELRVELLRDKPRHRAVLELAARKAGWDGPLAPGRGRGLAVHESFNTYVAQVAEVTLEPSGEFSVDRVVIAVDCGIAVNPDVIVAQMEGGMGFGLSATLSGAITLSEGRVDQSNFHDYPVLRIHKMPRVEVHIVKSAEPPTGVGEPATPVIAPAVANALAAATGRRFYRLPLDEVVTGKQIG